ncbi:FtsX-like permease family protein [Sorangium sp. So ce693]|uniref:ABC transporter permease n=1 Tax=Sorangium sp. So ce693 TaxID=3133318 RepID=UPI003F632888
MGALGPRRARGGAGDGGEPRMMFGHALWLARRSLGRQPGHTAIVLLAFTLGLAVWTAARAVLHESTSDPLASARGVYLVSVPHEGGAPVAPGAIHPPSLRDRVLLGSPHPSRKTDLFAAMAAGSADGGPLVPVVVAFCAHDLFGMFGIPVRSGALWSPAEGAGEDRPVVLTEAAERTLFGGASGLGRTLRLFGASFRVAGVVAIPAPPGTRASLHPIVFAPSAVGIALGVRPPLIHEREDPSGSFDALAASDNGWLELLVELPDEARRAAFQAELDAHVARERARGRRVLGAELVPRERVHALRVDDPGTTLFALLADVLLGACTLNAARLLEGKFRAKRAEIAIYRAFGASSRAVFLELLLEAMLVAAGSAALALGVAVAALALVNRVIHLRPIDYHLDARSSAATVAAALVLGLLAGGYPAWRAARQPPAKGLRRS